MDAAAVQAILDSRKRGFLDLDFGQKPKRLPQVAPELFQGCRSPRGAVAGVYVWLGSFESAHAVAQDLETPEGRYWHAIVHRMEPDSWNSGYWFRQLGSHPVFAALRVEAVRLVGETGGGFRVPEVWDPHRFIAFCDEVREEPAGALLELARRIHTAEWRLLFHHCTHKEAS